MRTVLAAAFWAAQFFPVLASALLEGLARPAGSFAMFFTFPGARTCPAATAEGRRNVPQASDDPEA